ncbi:MULTISPECIES: type IV pilin protein [Eisenbergiella]|uniref:Type II secretion system protein n=1 Tax=Eisenbergiella porci TaxID=2652274 RepID=A0A6N7WGI9_9FIRM|nr:MULTISPECIES: type II secretion system protein [Eisenbergiella]MDY2653138.1 type II secretion system protein [Eisenbergiella porci]MSS88608.1 type II secretion system protein [Eisenbergiella porci]
MRLFLKLKNDKKGFTLVGMIVVIIGILLAILVPGMFKYIDKAKDKIRNDIYGKWKKDNIR